MKPSYYRQKHQEKNILSTNIVQHETLKPFVSSMNNLADARDSKNNTFEVNIFQTNGHMTYLIAVSMTPNNNWFSPTRY